MKKILFLIILVLNMPAIAANHISKDTKASLKQLYQQINNVEDPYTNKDVSDEITRLVSSSCYTSAIRSLKHKTHLSFERTEMMKKVMRSTCNCVSASDEMIDGVIKSAVMFKEHGKHSSSAKSAMRIGIKQAKQKCFTKMRQQMQELKSETR